MKKFIIPAAGAAALAGAAAVIVRMVRRYRATI